MAALTSTSIFLQVNYGYRMLCRYTCHSLPFYLPSFLRKSPTTQCCGTSRLWCFWKGDTICSRRPARRIGCDSEVHRRDLAKANSLRPLKDHTSHPIRLFHSDMGPPPGKSCWRCDWMSSNPCFELWRLKSLQRFQDFQHSSCLTRQSACAFSSEQNEKNWDFLAWLADSSTEQTIGLRSHILQFYQALGPCKYER